MNIVYGVWKTGLQMKNTYNIILILYISQEIQLTLPQFTGGIEKNPTLKGLLSHFILGCGDL